jgi:hypothetical protein
MAINDLIGTIRGPIGDTIGNLLRRLPMPETLPAYRSLLIDEYGLLWIVLSEPGDSLTSMIAVNDKGIVQGTVAFAPQIRVTDVGRNYILGIYDAADTRSHVRLYQLTRGKGTVTTISH